VSYLIDTNQLLYAANPASPNFVATTEALRLLIEGQYSAFVTPQTLTEFWRSATRSLDAAPAGLGMTPDQAADEMQYYRDIFDFLPDVPDVFEEWLRIALIHAVRGVKVHDARLVAVMHIYSVKHILTANGRDFARFATIQAVTPEELPELLKNQ
jgi:predicted nucleic acid-binding protein